MCKKKKILAIVLRNRPQDVVNENVVAYTVVAVVTVVSS